MNQNRETKLKKTKQAVRTPSQKRVGDNSGDIVSKIKQMAKEVGYTACGITSTEPFKEFKVAINRRMDRFPQAAHLYSDMLNRVDPRSDVPWAESVVVCVRRYGKYRIPSGLAGYIGRNYLFDRRYEECPEHNVPEKMEEGLRRIGLRVQKGDVPDRWAGARAGVTRFGRNCFAYSEHGSWINIQTWLIDANLPPDNPTLEPACPKECRICIKACPTQALLEPFVMRMDRCVAYLTYRAQEPIPPELWEKMGTWIYGCDVCQEVCPLNKGKWEPLEKASWLEKIASYLKPASLAAMDQETYRNVIHPHFWYISLDNLPRWHANADRAMQNTPAARDT